MFAADSRHSLERRTEARRLRREAGMSIRSIAAQLHAAPSTVHSWTRDIELTPRQRKALRSSEAVRLAQAAGTQAMRSRARRRRLAAQAHGRRLAQLGNPLHLAGCMLYWGEGSKRRNDVEFTNSDPDMVRTFVSFLIRCHGVNPENIRLTLNVHLNNGLALAEIEAWWLAWLGLPRRCVRSHAVDRYSRASSQRRRNLPYGTARVVVHSTFIVQSIYGAIQEYSGTERPEWVDL